MGVELFRNSKFPEAEQMFSAAIQHNPKVSWFYTCRARTRYHLKVNSVGFGFTIISCYNLKDMTGSRADILFSLVLDPKSDSCVTLIACVYPGISKKELLHGQEVLEAQVKLQAVLRHVAMAFVRRSGQGGDDDDKSSPSASDVEGLSPKAAFHLRGLCLRMEEDTDDEKQEPLSQPASGVRGTSSVGKSSHEHPATLDTTSMEEGRKWEEWKKWEEIEEEEQGKEEVKKGEGEEMEPRKWCVLSCSIPELPCAPQSLLSMLQESVKEAQFHQAIYYSKKEVGTLIISPSVAFIAVVFLQCDKELVEALKVPIEAYVRPPPPRVQNIKDVVIGDRSIITASSLIKSLKR